MAMMTTMRNKMHAVLWAILILFLLSMTVGGLVGGANIIDEIFCRVDPSTAIGKVNGEIISPNLFSQQVGYKLDEMRAGGQKIDDSQFDRVRTQVWDGFVKDILVQQEIEELGLTVTDEEVIYHLQNNPPPALQQNQAFQTEGQFDPVKYAQAIANPQEMEQYWVMVENYMRDYIPRYKLQQLINSSVSVLDEEVREEYIKKNIDYTLNILHVTKNAFEEAAFESTDEELEAYYQENLESFQHDELRNLRFASWKKIPSFRDTMSVMELAMEVKDMALSGKDFATLANEYTEDPSNAVTPDSGKGGELGWFGKGQMVPQFEEVAFSAGKGEVAGPVLTQFGYHLIKVNGKKKTDENEQVNASHILFKIETSANTLEEIRRQATLFSYDAQDFSFDAAIDSHDVVIGEALKINEDDIRISNLGQMRSAARFAFRSEIGDVSDTFENENFVAVFTYDSTIPEGATPFEELKEQLNTTVKREKITDASKTLAEEIRLELDNASTFEDILSKNEKVSHVENDTKTLTRGFASIGRSNFVTGALLSAEQGDLVGPVKTSQGYALLDVVEIEVVDSTDFEIQKDVLKKNLLRQKQSSAFTNWLEGKKADAEIVDNRKYYY